MNVPSLTLAAFLFGAQLGGPNGQAPTADGVNAVDVYANGSSPKAGSTVSQAAKSILVRFLGRYPVKQVEPAALEAMLEEAREFESEFDSFEARVRRADVLRAYDALTRMTDAHVEVAARSLLDELASLVSDDEQFSRVAAVLFRRFPETRPDPAYYPPSLVERLENARAAITDLETGELIVDAGSATVFLDGRKLGIVNGTMSFQIPIGEYRIWAKRGNLASLSRKVVIGSLSRVQFDLDVEDRLNVDGAIRINCQNKCEELSARLGKLLQVDTLLLFSERNSETVTTRFDTSTGEFEELELDLAGPEHTWTADQALTSALGPQEETLFDKWWFWTSAGVIAAVGVTLALVLIPSADDEPVSINIQVPQLAP
ncbi:MAG: hypothetical protein AAFU77_08860 [Myxococcota bacterium]